MRKTLLLAVGAFALVASFAMAQAAFAGHETLQSTNALTGSVVPAYSQCTSGSGNTFHAQPIFFASCNTGLATRDISPLLKGRPYDKTTAKSGFTSSFSVTVVRPSNTLGSSDVVDVKVVNSSTGTLCENANLFLAAIRPSVCPSGTGGPFSGNVIGESVIRATDANNCSGAVCPAGSGTLHATVEDFTFSFIIPCTSGNCNLTSSADAQFGSPYNSAKDPTVNGRLADIEIQEVRVRDPGPNGTAGSACPLSCGDGDEKIAAVQGLFIK
jgi:hypothetical protein